MYITVWLECICPLWQAVREAKLPTTLHMHPSVLSTAAGEDSLDSGDMSDSDMLEVTSSPGIKMRAIVLA